MSKRSRIAIILLLTALVAIGTAMIPRTPQLLERAHKIGPLTPADSHYPLSDHTVLLIRSIQRPGMAKTGTAQYDLSIQDFASGTVTLQPALTRWYNKHCRPFNFTISVSPDGKWLLFWQSTAAMIGGGVVSINGRQHLEISLKCAPQRDPCWSADSRHVFVFPSTRSGRPDGALVYNMNAPNANKPLRSTDAFSSDASMYGSGRLYAPIDRDFRGAVSSPRGDQIVCEVNSVVRSPLREWLHRFLPSIGDGAQPYTSLWVIKHDGSVRHEIGTVAKGFLTDFRTGEALKDLKWTPEGRNLTFVYEDALWIVPVD